MDDLENIYKIAEQVYLELNEYKTAILKDKDEFYVSQ